MAEPTRLTDSDREELSRANHRPGSENCEVCFLHRRLDEARAEATHWRSEAFREWDKRDPSPPADAMEAAQEALRGSASKSHHGNGAVERVARAITAARADERRKVIEEAAIWHACQAEHHRRYADKYNDMDGQRSADKAHIHERSADCLRALSTKETGR